MLIYLGGIFPNLVGWNIHNPKSVSCNWEACYLVLPPFGLRYRSHRYLLSSITRHFQLRHLEKGVCFCVLVNEYYSLVSHPLDTQDQNKSLYQMTRLMSHFTCHVFCTHSAAWLPLSSALTLGGYSLYFGWIDPVAFW